MRYVCPASLHKLLLLNQLILQGLYVIYVVQVVFSGMGSLGIFLLVQLPYFPPLRSFYDIFEAFLCNPRIRALLDRSMVSLYM